MGKLFDTEALQKFGSSVAERIGSELPNVIGALGILVIGWLVALVVGKLVSAGCRKLGLNERLNNLFAGESAGEGSDVSRKVGRGVFYLIMLFVLVAFFQMLGLTVVTEPLNAFLNQVFAYAPRLFAAGILVLVAWIVARLLRMVVVRTLVALDIDRRLTKQASDDGESSVPVTKTSAEGVYWLVWLLFLPAILDALNMPGLLSPVQNLVDKIMSFLPNLFAAGMLFAVGWFVAKVVRKIVSSLLAAIGTDRLAERVGITKSLGGTTLSNLLGLVVYVLILIPVIVGALNALKIDAVTQPASAMLDTIVGALPGVLAAVLVVGLAYIVGRVASDLATNVLQGAGFDRLPAKLGLAVSEQTEGGLTLSKLVGKLILIAFVLFAIMQALPMMGFEMLAGLMADMLVFASKVLIGVVILAIGLFLAKLAADAIRGSGIANAGLLATIAKVGILVLAVSMALQRMGLADEIVNLAFGLTLGSVAVASALAFGIGGRDVAKSYLERLASRSDSQGK